MSDAWRNRPVYTQVFEHCPVCKELKQDVKLREFVLDMKPKHVLACLDCQRENASTAAIYSVTFSETIGVEP